MAIKDFVKKLFGRKNPVEQTTHDALIMKRVREHYEEALLHFPEDQIVGKTTANKYNIRNVKYVVKTVIAQPTLNVRKGPGLLNKKVGSVKYKEKVKVYETSGSWSRLDFVADEWVSTKYLK